MASSALVTCDGRFQGHTLVIESWTAEMHFLGLKLFTCQETCHVQYVHCVQNTNMCVICASVQGSLFAYRLHFCTWPQGFCVGHVSEYWIVFN